MQFWKEGLPTGIERDTALVILVINVFMPGVGTILSAFLGEQVMTVTIVIGIAQCLTSILVIGFVWAIAWSVVLYKTAARASTYQPVPSTAEADTNAETQQESAPLVQTEPASAQV